MHTASRKARNSKQCHDFKNIRYKPWINKSSKTNVVKLE